MTVSLKLFTGYIKRENTILKNLIKVVMYIQLSGSVYT